MPHHVTITERQALVAQWRASGLTMFAREHGVPFTSLRRWHLKYPPPTFSHVELSDSPSSPTLIVELAHTGHRIHVPLGFDATLLRRLMEASC
ncbi:hypothetical protein L6R49_05290 [Myxococcota bacterium]|nr:hypothetical protein [Myxococcota bacterium]